MHLNVMWKQITTMVSETLKNQGKLYFWLIVSFIGASSTEMKQVHVTR